MTPAELSAIEARCQAASPGPWRNNGDQIVDADGYIVMEYPSYNSNNNVLFVVDSRQDLPALLAEVRRLRGMLADIRGLGESHCRNVCAGSWSDRGRHSPDCWLQDVVTDPDDPALTPPKEATA